MNNLEYKTSWSKARIASPTGEWTKRRATPRPPHLRTEDALAEWKKLLSKSRLTKADEQWLKEIEAQIDDLPMEETSEDLQAMDIIRCASELLKVEQG